MNTQNNIQAMGVAPSGNYARPASRFMREDAQQRDDPMRDLFNVVRYVARTECQ
jgi:hypothetical protein